MPDGAAKHRYVSALKELGLDVQSFEYNATEYYHRAEDIMFLLQNTPIIPDFGKGKYDLEVFQRFISANQTAKGIKTNSKRYMIIAKKA